MIAKTILIADDDSDLADVLAVRCRQLGLKVLVAYDGLSALTLIDQQSPDLVCLDVNMPCGSGMDICKMLALDQALASIPVIMLTGRSDEDTICGCRSMGAHYLRKSTAMWDLLEPLVRRLLGLSPPCPDNPKRSGHAVRGRIPPNSFDRTLGGARGVAARNCSRGGPPS
ncbi:MAG: response regulator [Pirellulales bacterium]|nr:response regulator [Pirellulales bacterium]